MNSGFVWTAIYLLAFDVILTGVLPMLYPVYFDTNFPEPDQKCAKVINYLSADKDPPVVMLGSSLIRSAAAASDTGILDDPSGYLVNDYDRADFLKSHLSKELSANVDLVNLAMRGCMVSDYGLIIKKMRALGKHPKIVMVATAPAEFMSNDQPQVENTYVQQCLRRYQFPHDRSPLLVAYDNTVRWLAPHSLHAVETQLTYARRWLTSFLSDHTGHPMDIFNAQKKMYAEAGLPNPFDDRKNSPRFVPRLAKKAAAASFEMPEGTKNNQLSDLFHFKMRYQPPNTKLFDRHMHNFEAMLKFCSENEVPLVVVNMPITRENRALIDPTLLARYTSKMDDLTHRYKITYLNCEQSGAYQIDDFRDSTHLNVEGGRKFFAYLSKQLSKQSNLSAIAQTSTGKSL